MCECVVILRNLKDVSWAGAKVMMADTQFLRSLVEFDKDSLSEKQARAPGKADIRNSPGFVQREVLIGGKAKALLPLMRSRHAQLVM